MAQLKCLYTSALSMVNKWEELETTGKLENHDLIAVMEMWWDGSRNRNTGKEAYKKGFRRDGGQHSYTSFPAYVKYSGWISEKGFSPRGW